MTGAGYHLRTLKPRMTDDGQETRSDRSEVGRSEYAMLVFFPMKGFLGTGAPFGADLNLVVQLVMGIALIAGALLAKYKRYRAHGICQTSVLLLNLLMIGLVMWPSFQQQAKPALSKAFHKWYYKVATIHAARGSGPSFWDFISLLWRARTFFHSGCGSRIGSCGCVRSWCSGRLSWSAVWRRTTHGMWRHSGRRIFLFGEYFPLTQFHIPDSNTRGKEIFHTLRSVHV